MINILTRLSIIIFISFSFSACSDTINSPADQVINGPFKITTQWQEFTFDTPLTSLPYIQHIQLLSCNGELEIHSLEQNHENFFFLSSRFRRISDNTVIEPEVMAIINEKPYRFALSLSAHYDNTDLKGCISLGYEIATTEVDNIYYLPKNAKIESVKIKSNSDFHVDKIYWRALNYWKAPGKNWQDIPPTDIIDLSSLPN